MRYISLLVVSFLFLSCEKPMPDPPFEIECSEVYSAEEWNNEPIGNGYQISFPNDEIIRESAFYDAKPTGLIHNEEKFRLFFGLCDRNFISDPPCIDYIFYDDRDSLILPYPEIVILQQTRVLDKAFLLCEGNEVFGAVYYGWFEEVDRFRGKVYLEYEKEGIYYLSANFSVVEAESELLFNIIKSIQPE